MTETTPGTAPPPPQLIFDDGARIMAERKSTESAPRVLQFDGDNGGGFITASVDDGNLLSLEEYYEVDRLVNEIQRLEDASRVALQFPDELLYDAMDVCQAFQERLVNSLVFVLGDTTFAPCCPDVVAAAHLSATVLVHYGHACLSSIVQDMPIFYSFGKKNLQVGACVEATRQASPSSQDLKLLLLYELEYASETDALQAALNDMGYETVVGEIPSHVTHADVSGSNKERSLADPTNDLDDVTGCGQSHCCQRTKPSTTSQIGSSGSPPIVSVPPHELRLGGLHIPESHARNSKDDWSEYTLLYIGSDMSRQYMNIMLHFISTPSGTEHNWRWDPALQELSTELSPTFQKQLRRRFYHVQKAKTLSVFGILVANMSDSYTPAIVTHLQSLLQLHHRTAYTFAVGKINPHKLANFGEIECFVLVACADHSLLRDQDRGEYATPVIAPHELGLALGVVEWGRTPYSLQARAILDHSLHYDENTVHERDGIDNDAPYFSPVTGRYEQVPAKSSNEADLAATPGQGVLTTYDSAAATHLSGREYQGLLVQLGTTPSAVAVPGQRGIASNYGDR